ncbi:MAG: nitroreductase family protein [Pseudomonadota bacterium]
MTLFTVDPEKCKHDGLCAAVCPALLIEMEDDQSLPRPIPEAEEICPNCGHCVAVCPNGALTLTAMKPEDCLPLRQDLRLSPPQLEQFLRGRRSIRNYQDKPVPRELLHRVIELARYAPSGHNLQPVEWLVVEDISEARRLAGLTVDWLRQVITQDPETAARLHLDRVVRSWESGHDRIFRGAPHVIVAHAGQESKLATTSGVIALTYLELAASALGLGTCWAGYFQRAAVEYPPLVKALGLPRDHILLGALMIGYPKYKYARAPLRNQPKITWRS